MEHGNFAFVPEPHFLMPKARANIHGIRYLNLSQEHKFTAFALLFR